MDVLQRCSVASLQELCLHGEWVGGWAVQEREGWEIVSLDLSVGELFKFDLSILSCFLLQQVFPPLLNILFRQRASRAGRMSISEKYILMSSHVLTIKKIKTVRYITITS